MTREVTTHVDGIERLSSAPPLPHLYFQMCPPRVLSFKERVSERRRRASLSGGLVKSAARQPTPLSLRSAASSCVRKGA